MSDLLLNHFRESNEKHQIAALQQRTVELCADQAVIVTEGQVDVFLVQRLQGQLEGTRYHLIRLNQGDVFSGVDLKLDDLGVLLVSTHQTQCYLLSHTQLTTLWQQLPHTLQVIERQHWLVYLSTLFREIPTENAVMLKKGQSYKNNSSTEQLLYPAQDDVQIYIQSGDVFLAGYTDIALPLATWLALPANLWLSASSNTQLDVREDTDVLQALDSIQSMQHLTRMLLMVYWQRLQTYEQQHLERLTQAQQKDQQLLGAALHKLAAVVQPLGEDDEIDQTSQNLLAACRILGKRQGVVFCAPPKLQKSSQYINPVNEIAEASGVRCRKVALRGQWWTQDHGMLLAFDEQSKQPLVLLPQRRYRRHKRYLLCNPTTHKKIYVDHTIAASLDPFAWCFYRIFPEKPLKLIDIFRFSTFGVFREVFIIVGVGILGGLLGMAIPIASGYLFDTAFPAADKNLMMQVVIALLIASVVNLLFGLTRSFALLRVESRMGSDIQAAVWDRVLKLPTTFFRDYSVGDLAMRINGINTIREMLSGTVVGSLMSALFSLINVVLLFFYSAKLAVVAIILVLIAIIFSLLIGYLSMRIARKAAEQEGKVSGMVFEFLSGIVKLRVTYAESRAFANWAKEFSHLRRLQWQAGRLQNISQVFNAVFPILANIAIFSVISIFILQDQQAAFSTGTFIAFMAAFATFLTSTLSVAETAINLLHIVPLYERTKPILEATPEVSLKRAYPNQLQGAVEISNLTFSYQADTPLVLNNISLSIRPGEFVALVGASGSGKSTLLRLLLGFEKPVSGAIYYDGSDLNDLNLGAVRRQLGVVLQNGRLMSGDIFSNIIGSTSLTMEDAIAAAKASGLYTDIQAMPMGMHTWVSEGGSTLSGGQRQRLLIARALVNKPRIIIFDEATSALDNRTQSIVSTSMEQMRATRIVVAHRLSTIIRADRIIVLDKGQIVQMGTYQELIEQTGLFAELAHRQIA